MKVIVNNIDKLNDAFEMIVSGADGIGVSIDKEKKLDMEKANDLVFYLPPISTSVLVTKSVAPISITSDANNIGVNTILFEGDILEDDIKLIREKLPYIKVIKKIIVSDKDSIKVAERYKKSVDAILLETDIMSNDNLLLCKKIIDECDYVLFKAEVTKDCFAVVKELNPYGIVIDYNNQEKIKEFIGAIG